MKVMLAAAAAATFLTFGVLTSSAMAADDQCADGTAVTIVRADGSTKVVCVEQRAADGAETLATDTGTEPLVKLVSVLDDLQLQEQFDPTDVASIRSVAKDLGIDLDAFGASQLSDVLAASHPGGRTSLTDTLKAGLHGMAAPGLEGTTRDQLLGDLEVGPDANASAWTYGDHKPGEFELYASATGDKIQKFMTTPQGDFGKPGGWLVPATGDPAKDANSQFNPGTPSLAERMRADEQKKRDDAAAGKDPTDEAAKKKVDEIAEAARKQIEAQKEKERKEKEEKEKQDKEKEAKEKEEKEKDNPAEDKDKAKDKDKDKKDEEEKDKKTTFVDPDYVESSGGPLTPIQVEEMQTLLVNSLQNFGNPLDHDQEPVNPGSAHNPNSDPTVERWTGDELPSIGQMVTGAFEAPLRLQIAPVDPPQGGDGTEPGPPRNSDGDTVRFGDVG